MARLSLQSDWDLKNQLFEVQNPKGDLKQDKLDVIKLAREALDEAEKALDDSRVAQSTAPIARVGQANTPPSPQPKPERSDGLRRRGGR